MMTQCFASGAMADDSSKKVGSEIPEGFEKLIDSARKKVSENCTAGSQAIVVETANNVLYCRVIADAAADGRSGEMAFIEEVRTSGDTEVRRIVCMWHDGMVDLPSYNLRKALIELNPKNEESLILLNGGIHYAAKALKTTM